MYSGSTRLRFPKGLWAADPRIERFVDHKHLKMGKKKQNKKALGGLGSAGSNHSSLSNRIEAAESRASIFLASSESYDTTNQYMKCSSLLNGTLRHLVSAQGSRHTDDNI